MTFKLKMSLNSKAEVGLLTGGVKINTPVIMESHKTLQPALHSKELLRKSIPEPLRPLKP